MCKELEGGVLESGSSVISRLHALSGRVTSRLKGVLFLDVKKTLGVVSTHYLLDMARLREEGYVIPPELAEDEEFDAAAEETAKTFSEFFHGDLFPDADNAKKDVGEA